MAGIHLFQIYWGDDFMNSLFEYSDRLNAPFECFLFDTRIHSFPIRSHWHYFVEILYMLEGTAIINCDDDTYVLEEGDMTLFLPANGVFRSIVFLPAQYVPMLVLW